MALQSSTEFNSYSLLFGILVFLHVFVIVFVFSILGENTLDLDNDENQPKEKKPILAKGFGHCTYNQFTLPSPISGAI